MTRTINGSIKHRPARRIYRHRLAVRSGFALRLTAKRETIKRPGRTTALL